MIGPLMIDLKGKIITPEERIILAHPLIGGVILFTRNYESIVQLERLTADIHSIKKDSKLLIAVDHEGGRVQRFRAHFTQLPPARIFGEIYDHNSKYACDTAATVGWLMAVELQSVGVDFSFAPVLDIDLGMSSVIGDRAFHTDPKIVTILAKAYIQGMKNARMATVGKHFPGHGSVVADSHLECPIDTRTLDAIKARDLISFRELISKLDGIMPAHILYTSIDSQPASFSEVWLKSILRNELGFKGAIISDDLTMAGASTIGNMVERVYKTLAAGGDMALICNYNGGYSTLLKELDKITPNLESSNRLAKFYSQEFMNRTQLQQSLAWHKAVEAITNLPFR
ncbi:beta-N-acetylhexosaminidase [Candidatus Nitrosacidococcus tergens]|uniref:Beta-hexosaminidase n=1 Tax=Candidatus Nitrosacidococcus tergens TaxID=553981 RepID=A0A7G1QA52_9GAMM|nr:beta-N-acetylhexosaminidase [Candidatus Nitrosacidococcus tergens]CAB1276426.1 Beta-hexosaminidase [Candidatus Nitrosacidococcus tergens]